MQSALKAQLLRHTNAPVICGPRSSSNKVVAPAPVSRMKGQDAPQQGYSVVAAAAQASGQTTQVVDTNEAQKGSSSTSKAFALKSAVCYLPHPDKVHYGGEDAFFLSDVGGGALGVADGVGGWQESGVNPADYSRTLMRLSCAFLEGRDVFEEEAKARPPGPLVDPRAAMHAAHSFTKVPGSATCCVMQVDQERKALVAANLGDSGFIVVRNGQVLVKTRALQHYFDCPLQFGAFPEYVEATDTADMADLYNVPLQAGDIIVAGSDGLWDNAYENEIVELLPRNEASVQGAADRIAAVARQHAGDTNFASPYTREALAQGLDLPWWEKLFGASFKGGRFQLRQLTGGKMDDITVVVSLVVEQEKPAPAAADAPTPPAADGPAA